MNNDGYPIDPYKLLKAFELLNQTLANFRIATKILITDLCSNLAQVLKNNQSLGNKIEMIR